jgi:predicted short-subunit dehydrogenase-like oxidoreductase (DUF2520 family)
MGAVGVEGLAGAFIVGHAAGSIIAVIASIAGGQPVLVIIGESGAGDTDVIDPLLKDGNITVAVIRIGGAIAVAPIGIGAHID